MAHALIVLPEGAEPRTLRAAVECARRGIARCLLLGAPDEVAAQARHLGLRLPEGVSTVAERYVAPLAELVAVRAGTPYREMSRHVPPAPGQRIPRRRRRREGDRRDV